MLPTEPDLQAAHGQYRCRFPRRALQMDFTGANIRAVRVFHGGSARTMLYMAYDKVDFDIPVGCQWRPVTIVTSSAWRRCAGQPDHPTVHRLVASEPGAGERQPQDRIAAAPRDESNLDGRTDPPFQAVHRGFKVPGGRGLRRDRAPEGGRRVISFPMAPINRTVEDPEHRVPPLGWTKCPRPICSPTFSR